MGLIYQYFKYNARFISHLYFRNVIIDGLENIPNDTPVLLLPNHPNSFLDPALIAAALSRPTHFLARGDLFRKPLVSMILRSFNILPIFRESEGREHLTRNYGTIDSCLKIFSSQGMVLVFPEGLTRNAWELRELKKGPFRIALRAWNSIAPANQLVIVPIGLTYEHFSGAGNTILLRIGKPFLQADFDEHPLETGKYREFLRRYTAAISELALIHPELSESHPHYPKFRSALQDMGSYLRNAMVRLTNARKVDYPVKQIKNNSWIHKTLILYPLYGFCNLVTPKLIHDNAFHDAIRFALFLILWPIYIIVLGLLLNLFFT